MMLATLIQARASSSVTSTYSNSPRPRPPCSAPIMMPKNPILPIWATSSSGISPCTGIELVGQWEDLVHGELPGQVADDETVVGGVSRRE